MPEPISALMQLDAQGWIFAFTFIGFLVFLVAMMITIVNIQKEVKRWIKHWKKKR